MRAWAAFAAMLVGTACRAQTPAVPIGSVLPADATVANEPGAPAMQLVDGRAMLAGNVTVTAKDHTAPIALARGGEVRACIGTAVHLTASADGSLLLALDRGAMEVKTAARAGDVLITPDLRFTLGQAAPLDLQMRVTSAGDTCVDNRGHRAPTLEIGDAFGQATYELKPGQHVTFEHGSLREVVDKENVPCGCPPEEGKRGSLADAALAGGADGKPMTPAEKSAAEHPFPAAVSDGLVPPSPAPPQAPNVTHVEVAATLAFDPTAAAQPTGASVAPPALRTAGPTPGGEPQKRPGGPLRAIGRFFQRLFAR